MERNANLRTLERLNGWRAAGSAGRPRLSRRARSCLTGAVEAARKPGRQRRCCPRSSDSAIEPPALVQIEQPVRIRAPVLRRASQAIFVSICCLLCGHARTAPRSRSSSHPHDQAGVSQARRCHGGRLVDIRLPVRQGLGRHEAQRPTRSNLAILNPHLHTVFLDGVFAPNAADELVFHPLPSRSSVQLADLLQAIRNRTLGWADSPRRGSRTM
jgi:hypothetical protein